MTAAWLVRFYPRPWRERYGEEFTAILAEGSCTVGMMLDVLAGAVDAHLHPQVHARQTEGREGDAMTADMMQRCASGGPVLTEREKLRAGFWMAGNTLLLAVLYVVLTKLYHHASAVEGLGYTILPATLWLYTQAAYLRARPLTTRLVLGGGMLGFLYLVMWGACAIASGLGRHHGL